MTSTIVAGCDRTGIQSQSDYFSHVSRCRITLTVSELEKKSAPSPAAARKNGIPAGFPTSVVSSAAWTGSDFENGQGRERFTLALDEFDLKEIEQACKKFQGVCPPRAETE
jgi:hypothetical protein